MSSLNRHRGISLFEVLVALVVLSVGLLGVAALLVQSVQGTRTALYRTSAINLVSDMADRIRANASAGAAYAVPGPVPVPQTVTSTCQFTRAAGGARSGTNCTAAQLAADDLARWRLGVRGAFPQVNDAVPGGTVQYIAGTPETWRITVNWQEPGSTQAGVLDAYSYTTDVVMMPR
jgi:type IV pilus assembly protein PilV